MTFGLLVLASFGVTIGAIAAFTGGRGAYKTYIACVSVLTLVGIVFSYTSIAPDYPRLRAAAVSVLMFVPLGTLYCFAPGLLVRRAASPGKILLATTLASIVGIPIWYVYVIVIACVVGHDCL